MFADVGPKTRSLRDAHKRRTKRALRDAALKLFAARGYDSATTEEVAERAGVSARTFFRYFPTKESVLFEGESAWFETFAATYHRQPKELSDIDAIRATYIETSPSIAQRRAALRLYERSIASSPTLRGLKQDNLEQVILQLANAVAERRGLPAADEAALLLASGAALAHRRAIDRWLATQGDSDLGGVIADEFDVLTSTFADRQPGRKRPPPAVRVVTD